MKRKHILIYSILISLVYLIGISIFTISIVSEKNSGILRTQVRNDRFNGHLKRNIEKNPIASNQFYNKLNEDIGDISDFRYLYISINGKGIYLYPSSLEVDTNPDSNLIRNFEKSYSVNNNSVQVQAQLYIVRPNIIYKNIKILFTIILLGTIFTIIFIYLCEKSNLNKENINNEEDIKNSELDQDTIEFEENLVYKTIDFNQDSQEESQYDSISQEESEEYIIEEDENQVIENEVEIKDEDEKFNLEDSQEDSNNLQEESSIQVENEINKKEKEVELPIEDIKPLEQASALFSPHSGLVYEMYALQRITDEIKRATASEIDLSLFIIKIPGLNRDTDIAKDLSNYLISEFQFKDLLFEYKDDSILAIKLSMEVDDALNFADKIYCEIISKIKNIYNKCYIGISSRSVRMISGERLIKETEEAVKHAMEDLDSPIVAFRANTAKYKEYMENN